MNQPVNVQIPNNFEHNLESIRCYFHQEASQQSIKYKKLLDTLFDKIIPNLQEHPSMGFDFLAQTVNTIEEQRQVSIINSKLPKNTSIRQYNDTDYIVLYSLTSTANSKEVFLLSIKHQQQQLFELQGLD